MIKSLSNQWVLSEMPELRGFSVEWAEAGRFILARGNHLFHTSDLAQPPQFLASFPAPMWKSVASRFRPFQRALRFFFYNALPLTDGTLLATFAMDVALLKGSRFRRLEGLKRPARVLRNGIGRDAQGRLYLGEYFSNPERHPVHVYRFSPGEERLHVAHRFEAGRVRHVHGLYGDPDSDGLWCLTGDRGDECCMFHTRDGFQTLDEVGRGDESWRAVSLLFSRQAVYYGSDGEFSQNYLYRIDRKSGRRQKLAAVGGPVFYSARLGEDMLFLVAAELCPSQRDRHATIWQLTEVSEPRPIVRFEKDWLSKKYFMFGLMHFALGPDTGNRLLLHGIALRQGDNRTFELKRAAAEGTS